MSRIQRSVLLVEAFALFHLIALALHLFSYQRVAKLALRKPRKQKACRSVLEEQEFVTTIREAIRLIKCFDFRSWEDCLPRTLMAYYSLTRRGVPVEVRFGVTKEPFGAHAWVEYRGDVISDRMNESRQHTPLVTAPERRSMQWQS
jgi:hypothetical protein